MNPSDHRGEEQQLELAEAVARRVVGLLDDLERDRPALWLRVLFFSASARAFAPSRSPRAWATAPAPGSRLGQLPLSALTLRLGPLDTG